MAILVVADIHSNLEALEAVLVDATGRSVIEGVWCLGDIVGYGPQPRECIAALRGRSARCIAGNHDLAAVGRAPLEAFNELAAEACRWTADRLSDDDRVFLAGLPQGWEMVPPLRLVHGSPCDPVWEYVASEQAAAAGFDAFDEAACLVGHSHYPLVFTQSARGAVRGRRLNPEERTVIGGKRRIIYNPGSVGQPRDGDPRAAYALYDPATAVLWHFRVDYDIEATQRRMRAAGLPGPLVERLSVGR